MKVSQRLADLMCRVNNVCVLTGAGISAESGVPTFRSPDGLWSKFKPEELANFDAFMRNPTLVWEWYQHRRTVMRDVQPNAGHRALAELEEMIPAFTLVTQNVDNLHARAGSRKVLELHGNLERSYCVQCGAYAADATTGETVGLPRCKRCGGMLRPDVVWFGEMLPQDIFGEAEEAAGNSELFLTVGTSAVVYPAASLPHIAREHGAYVVEVNPEVTEVSQWVDERLGVSAGEALPALAEIRRLRKER
jgi:NAD-dependent deacetylase